MSSITGEAFFSPERPDVGVSDTGTEWRSSLVGTVRGGLGRLAWAALSTLAVMTGVFLLVLATPDELLAARRFAANKRGETLDVPSPPPVHERYGDWLESFVTLDWGTSRAGTQLFGQGGGQVSNLDAVLQALPVTLVYAVPATLLAFTLALWLGYRAAARPRATTTNAISTGMYVVFSVPNFFLAAVVFFTLQDADPGWFPKEYVVEAGLSASNLLWLALPGVVLCTHLVAGYFRYSRSEAHESLREEYVKLLRSKGADSRRIARHVFREAAAPLVTLFVTELLGVLLVTVFVIEVVFEVPGIGRLAYLALEQRDIELVMVLTVLFSMVGIVANVVQDVAVETLDARID